MATPDHMAHCATGEGAPAPSRCLSDIHSDALTVADALALVDGLVLATRHDQAGYYAVLALVAPLARKLADDLEEVL